MGLTPTDHSLFFEGKTTLRTFPESFTVYLPSAHILRERFQRWKMLEKPLPTFDDLKKSPLFEYIQGLSLSLMGYGPQDIVFIGSWVSSEFYRMMGILDGPTHIREFDIQLGYHSHIHPQDILECIRKSFAGWGHIKISSHKRLKSLKVASLYTLPPLQITLWPMERGPCTAKFFALEYMDFGLSQVAWSARENFVCSQLFWEDLLNYRVTIDNYNEERDSHSLIKRLSKLEFRHGLKIVIPDKNAWIKETPMWCKYEKVRKFYREIQKKN